MVTGKFKKYARTNIAEMLPWEEGMELIDVSISKADYDAGSPRPGDMIARNPTNWGDQWLVAKKYFKQNFTLYRDPLIEGGDSHRVDGTTVGALKRP